MGKNLAGSLCGTVAGLPCPVEGQDRAGLVAVFRSLHNIQEHSHSLKRVPEYFLVYLFRLNARRAWAVCLEIPANQIIGRHTEKFSPRHHIDVTGVLLAVDQLADSGLRDPGYFGQPLLIAALPPPA